MTKQMVEIDVPDGYEFVRIDPFGDIGVLGGADYLVPKVHFKKKQPERIIFERSIEKRQVTKNELYLDEDGTIYIWQSNIGSRFEYYILTKVEE